MLAQNALTGRAFPNSRLPGLYGGNQNYSYGGDGDGFVSVKDAAGGGSGTFAKFERVDLRTGN